MSEDHLVTVCGLYCGACVLYRTLQDGNAVQKQELIKTLAERWGVPPEEVDCEGCLGDGKLSPYCRSCQILRCPSTKKDVKRCSDCPDFPCDLIINFNNDGVRHHAEVLDNIKDQQKVGVQAWLNKQKQRWQCPQCGSPVSWYTRTCDKCGREQPYRLPSLPRDKKQ